MSTRYFITGFSGLIGQHVVRELQAEGGAEFYLADLPQMQPLMPKGATFVPLDLGQDQSGLTLPPHDVFINIAAIFNFAIPEDVTNRVNHLSVPHLVRAAKKAGAKRFTQVSTVGVYGEPKQTPAGEDAPHRPRSAYERTKNLGEMAAWKAAKEHNIDLAVVRPTLVYGPESRYGHALTVAMFALARAKGLKKFPAVRKGTLGHHVHVEDVARAIALVARHPDAVGRAFNVADDNPIPGRTFMDTIASALDMRTIDMVVPDPVVVGALRVVRILPMDVMATRNARMLAAWNKLMAAQGKKSPLKPELDPTWFDYVVADYVYDTRAIKSLGFRFKHPDFVPAMAETIQWYRKQGWLPDPKN